MASSDPTLSPLMAFAANIWFFGLSFAVCFMTETYFEFAVAFGVHYFVFLGYALPFKSEKFYDFTGMVTFISVTISSFLYRGVSLANIRSVVLSVMVLCWTLRLGLFLFWRILQHQGKDSRFDALRNGFWVFLMVWTMSSQWVYFCVMPVVLVNKNHHVEGVTISDMMGWTMFVFGWAIEVISDRQKTQFKADPKNEGKFVRSGLWSVSRHPNYFGNIMLFLGIAISASSEINFGVDWFVFVSPFWTIMLLVFMSGIPPAERTFAKKYRNAPGYREYKLNTPILIPFCVCWK